MLVFLCYLSLFVSFCFGLRPLLFVLLEPCGFAQMQGTACPPPTVTPPAFTKLNEANDLYSPDKSTPHMRCGV